MNSMNKANFLHLLVTNHLYFIRKSPAFIPCGSKLRFRVSSYKILKGPIIWSLSRFFLLTFRIFVLRLLSGYENTVMIVIIIASSICVFKKTDYWHMIDCDSLG